LTRGQRAVLRALADWMDADGRGAWPSLDAIADSAGYSRAWVTECLSAAEAAGWLARDRTRELVADDCFGAVFEATKGLAQRIRQMTGLDLDGYRLVDAAFGGQAPMVALNSLRSDTERNEQTGLANLMRGMFSAFRNPTAHEPRVSWHVAEPDALDLLSTLSLVHRRLDAAVVLRRL